MLKLLFPQPEDSGETCTLKGLLFGSIVAIIIVAWYYYD